MSSLWNVYYVWAYMYNCYLVSCQLEQLVCHEAWTKRLSNCFIAILNSNSNERSQGHYPFGECIYHFFPHAVHFLAESTTDSISILMSFFFKLPINTNLEPLKLIISTTYTANRLIFTVWMRRIDPIYNIWFSLMFVDYVNVILPLSENNI